MGIVSVSQAQEIRNVTFGWGNAMRLGRWTPVFITIEDAQTREVDLQIHGSYGEKSEALWLHQTAPAQPLPVTYAILFPINTRLSQIVVSVSDRATGKTLDAKILQNPAKFTPAGQVPIRLLNTDETLIGISGNVDDALRLQAQLDIAKIPAGVLDPLKLPANFAGYDGISLLILAGADIAQLSSDQEQAMLDWARRGGNIIVIPGTAPLPSKSALVEALPCSIGDNRTASLPTNSPATQPSTLNARELTAKPGSEAIQLLDQTGYSRRLGLGRIVVLPVDVSPIQFTDSNAANSFWQPILSPMVKVSPIKTPGETAVNDSDEERIVAGPNAAESVGRGQRESVAIRHVLEMMGATGTASAMNWSSALLVFVGICFLVGPVDSVILMRFGQPPRNWLTLAGWIGLILSVGVYAVGKIVSPSASVATFRLVDQVDDSLVGATDIIAINSTRPMTVPLSLDPNTWWEPANQAARSFSANRFVDANCRQDKTGCRPESVCLNGREAQAWHGETATLGNGLLTGNLRVATDRSGAAHLTGKLMNAGKSSMTDVIVTTSTGNFRVGQSISPGRTIDVDAASSSDPLTLDGLPADVKDVSPERADRFDALMKQGFAAVTCQMPDAQDVKVGQPVDQHWQVLRTAIELTK